MNDVSTMSQAVLRRVGEFLDGLPDNQLADLANGRGRLAYLPPDAPAPSPTRAPAGKTPKAAFDVDDVLARLKEANTRDEGRTILGPLAIKELRAVATGAGLTGISRTKKEELLEQVVSMVIGGRLSFAAFRDL